MMIADGCGAQHDLDLALGVRARTGLSGKSALAVDVGPLGAGTGAGVAENGPLKATGFAVGMGRDRNRRRTSGRVLAAHRVGHRCRDYSRDEMVRSRANEGPYRKWVCPTLPGHFASWLYVGGVVLTKRRSAVEFEPRIAAGTRKSPAQGSLSKAQDKSCAPRITAR